MVTIKIPGLEDIKLSPIEFNHMVQAMIMQVRWGNAGMYGDGEEINDKVGYERAKRIIEKLGYGRIKQTQRNKNIA